MTQVVVVLGLRELREALMRKIPQHFQGAVLQKALLAGAKPIVAEAQIRSPEPKTGTLYRAIYSFRDRTGSTRTFESRLIAVRQGRAMQRTGRDAFYWRWIEFGRGAIVAKAHRQLGTTAHGWFGPIVRLYPPHPFLRPAFEGAKNQAVEQVKAALITELWRAAEKARWSTDHFLRGGGGEVNFGAAEASSMLHEAGL